MTGWAAFLRAVNVGRRKMKMSELKAVCEGLGYNAVKTILASGNVRFETPGHPKAALEAAIEAQWGWRSEAIVRRLDALEAMLRAEPFRDYPPSDAYHRYVMLLDAPLPGGTRLCGVAGDYEVVRADSTEIYLLGYRQPDGRHGPGLDKFDRQLDKGVVATTRNWNTIPRMLN